MATPTRLALVRSPSSFCLGIDLAGVEHRETGVAILDGDRLVHLGSLDTDATILALAATLPPDAAIAINAPLTLPLGRCCLDDACRCRHDPGTRSREIERELARGRIPTLATALIKVLARRGIRLADALRAAGRRPLEVYPFATLRLLGLPTGGKRSRAGRRVIHAALQPLVPGLDHSDASEHQLDAVVCALTARLWQRGRTRTVGRSDEGLMVVPDVPYPTTPARRPALPRGRANGRSPDR
ncbi:MAG: DUF429 domain-containing protein [Chloroflexota bacterium]|nr:DUF429 domain-containing protein [Chloroflexota bacterium]